MYPPTAATFDSLSAGANSVVAGAYIQRMCRHMADVVASITTTTTITATFTTSTHTPTTTVAVQIPLGVVSSTSTSSTTSWQLIITTRFATPKNGHALLGRDMNVYSSVSIVVAALLIATACLGCVLGASRNHKRAKRRAGKSGQTLTSDFSRLPAGESGADGASAAAALLEAAEVSPTVTTGPLPSAQVGVLSPLHSLPRQRPFVVSIDRSDGGVLGIEVDYTVDGGTVVVSSVSVRGQVASWNSAQPRCQVMPGDRIVEVNGVHSDAEAMMSQLRAYQSLKFTVLPREVA